MPSNSVTLNLTFDLDQGAPAEPTNILGYLGYSLITMVSGFKFKVHMYIIYCHICDMDGQYGV